MLRRLVREGLWVALLVSVLPGQASAQPAPGSVHIAIGSQAGSGITIGSLSAVQASVVNLFGETAKTFQTASASSGLTLANVPPGSTYRAFVTAIVNGRYSCTGASPADVPFIVTSGVTTPASVVLDSCQDGFGVVFASIPSGSAAPNTSLRLNYQMSNATVFQSGWFPSSDAVVPVLLGLPQGSDYRFSVTATDDQHSCHGTSEAFSVDAQSSSPLTVPMCCTGNVAYGNLTVNLLPPSDATIVSAHYNVRNQTLGYATTYDASGNTISANSGFFCGLPPGPGWEVFVSANVTGGACRHVTGAMGLEIVAGDTINAISLVDCLPPGATCGNGALDSDEACDEGPYNGRTDSCCSSSCQFKPRGTPCAGSGNRCAPAQLDACLAGVCVAAVCQSQNVEPGGTVSTGGTATAAQPVEATVTTPSGGIVSIAKAAVSSPAPPGYSLVGEQVNIQAPDTTTTAPMALVFDIDTTNIPLGTAPAAVGVWRNGIEVPPCAGPGPAAVPDPCKVAQSMPNGDMRIRVRSSKASVWTFTTALPSVPALGTPASAALAGLLLGGAFFALRSRSGRKGQRTANLC